MSSVAPVSTMIGEASEDEPSARVDRLSPSLNTPFDTMIGCAYSPPCALKVNVPDPVLRSVPGPLILPAPLSVTSPSAAIAMSFASTSAGNVIVSASKTVAFA